MFYFVEVVECASFIVKTQKFKSNAQGWVMMVVSPLKQHDLNLSENVGQIMSHICTHTQSKLINSVNQRF